MTSRTSAKTIGLFGGSFNPPHVAHVLIVGWAFAVGEVDEVWIIPTGGHPFGKPLAPFEDRLQMCRLAFACYGERVRMLDSEREQRVHYSVDTVRRLTERNADLRWRWIIGSDALAQSAEWKDFKELSRMAPPLVIRRMGHAARNARTQSSEAGGSEFTPPDVSSTFIRDRLAGPQEGYADLAGLVPHSVLAYIRRHRLYESA